MPPKSTVIENELDYAAMRDLAMRATTKQYEDIPLSVLAGWCT